MRLVRRRKAGDRVPYPILFGVIAVLAAAAAWARILLTSGWIPSLCLFRRLTGIPCPACHSTRALAALFTGRFGLALASNPLTTLVAVGCVAAGLLSAAWKLAGREPLALEIGPREAAALRAAVVFLLAANWIYLIASR